MISSKNYQLKVFLLIWDVPHLWVRMFYYFDILLLMIVKMSFLSIIKRLILVNYLVKMEKLSKLKRIKMIQKKLWKKLKLKKIRKVKRKMIMKNQRRKLVLIVKELENGNLRNLIKTTLRIKTCLKMIEKARDLTSKQEKK